MKQKNICVIIYLIFSMLIMGCTTEISIDNKTAALKEKIEKKYPGSNVIKIKYIQNVKLFEVLTDKNVIIVDENVSYAFIGDIYDIQNNKKINILNQKNNYRKLKLNDHKELDRFSQFIEIKGNTAKHKITVFTDIYCNYCKQLESVLSKLDGVQINRVVYPNINTSLIAQNKVATILCDVNPLETYKKYMLNLEKHNSDVLIKPECHKKVNDNVVLAKTIGIYGTPIIINKNGDMFVGVPSFDELQDFITNIN